MSHTGIFKIGLVNCEVSLFFFIAMVETVLGKTQNLLWHDDGWFCLIRSWLDLLVAVLEFADRVCCDNNIAAIRNAKHRCKLKNKNGVTTSHISGTCTLKQRA